MIAFTVPGEPLAKGCARATIRAGHISHYTPDKTARYENLVKLAAQQAMAGATPLAGAVSLTLRVFFAIPSSWSLKKQRAAATGELAHTKRPDLDNVLKAIKDGANGVAWHDDSQVVEVRASKCYGSPRVEVELTQNTAALTL